MMSEIKVTYENFEKITLPFLREYKLNFFLNFSLIFTKLQNTRTNKDARILRDSSDTVARRTCEHDGVGELGTPRGVSQARVARRICGRARYTVCAIIFNLSRALF